MLLRSPLKVGAPREPRAVLLRSTPGSELLRSQGRCSSGAEARGGSYQKLTSLTTPTVGGGTPITQFGFRLLVLEAHVDVHLLAKLEKKTLQVSLGMHLQLTLRGQWKIGCDVVTPPKMHFDNSGALNIGV